MMKVVNGLGPRPSTLFTASAGRRCESTRKDAKVVSREKIERVLGFLAGRITLTTLIHHIRATSRLASTEDITPNGLSHPTAKIDRSGYHSTRFLSTDTSPCQRHWPPLHSLIHHPPPKRPVLTPEPTTKFPQNPPFITIGTLLPLTSKKSGSQCKPILFCSKYGMPKSTSMVGILGIIKHSPETVTASPSSVRRCSVIVKRPCVENDDPPMPVRVRCFEWSSATRPMKCRRKPALLMQEMDAPVSMLCCISAVAASLNHATKKNLRELHRLSCCTGTGQGWVEWWLDGS